MTSVRLNLNSKSVAYISHDSLSEGIGMSQIKPLVIGLAEMGWVVQLVTMEKVQPPKWLKEELGTAGVHWTILRFGKRGLLGGFFRVVTLALRIPIADIYHCRGDLAALSVALHKNRKFLWDVRGIWGEQKMVNGSARSNYLMRKIFSTIEKYVAKRARAVTCLAQALWPILEERVGELPRVREVIPTCVDIDKFQMRESFPKSNTLLLSGVFNDFYDLAKTKEVISYLKDSLKFDVIWCRGAESSRRTLDVGEDEIRTKTQIEMPGEIANSTVGLALCKSSAGVSLAGVMPTKIAEFLATGRPVIVSSGMGDLDDLVKKNRIGVVIDDASEKTFIIEELKKLLIDPEVAKRCRDVANSHFSMKTAIVRYSLIYEKLIFSKS